MIEAPIKPYRQGAHRAWLDLTPMIDIVFIVLVFLLLCMNRPVIELPFSLPKDRSVEASSESQADELVITLHALEPYYEIEGQRLHIEDSTDFLEALLSASANLGIVIASNATAPVEPLLRLLALLKRHQIENTHILMEKN